MNNDICDVIDTKSLTGTLNDLLRQKLTSDLPVPSVPDQTDKSVDLADHDINHNSLPNTLLNAVNEILNVKQLNRSSLDHKLQSLFNRLYEIYQHTGINYNDRTRQYISAQGLIMSPDHCVTTQKDSLRVRAFIRGIDQAISKLKSESDGCLHIAYPACGPFAPLLLPLIGYYKLQNLFNEKDLQISLIDIQPGAVASLKAIVEELGINQYIREICFQDACSFQSDLPIDIVIIEAMQHGLSREGHLAIARHFASIMRTDGIFLPQEITLRAVLGFGQREYVDQWSDNHEPVCETLMLKDIIDERVELSEILRVTPDSLRKMQDVCIDKYTRLLPCNEVLIPELNTHDSSPLLLICTEMVIYGKERLGEYDSGITHPLPDMQVCINFNPHDAKPGDLIVKSGDKLKFYYRLNGLPGFMATFSENTD